MWTAYLRMNGARIGRRVYINTLLLSDHNLLAIGDDVVIGANVCLSGHTVESGLLKTGRVTIGNRVDSREREMASIVGPLCTPLDLIADKMEMPRAKVGDLVVVFQSGAYGLTASPTRFLSHPEPKEILV